jgi:hypothetical protein
VQAQYRYLPDPADVEPHDFGKRAVREIFDRLQSAGMTSFLGDAWLSTAATRQL